MKILITGGNGYVGRAVTRLLCREHEVTVVDNLRYKQMRFSDEEQTLFRFERIDILDYEDLQSVFRLTDPDIVIHLAAIHYIPECDAKPSEAAVVNIIGTINVLRACKPGCRVVFASTAAVYAPESTPHQEDISPVGPTDVYGLTKLHAEHFVSLWTRTLNLKTTIVRLFNVVGPGETNPHLLPAIFAQAIEGNRVLRLGNCFPKRDYVHVNDAAEAFASIALHTPAAAGQPDIVNVGTGSSYSVTEVVQTLSDIIGKPMKIEVDPARLRPVDRPFVAAATGKAKTVYGWSAQRTLLDSLSDLWSNPDIPQLNERLHA